MSNRLLVPVIASAFLVAAFIPTATAADPKPRPAWIEMDLPASNGIRAHLRTSSEGIELDLGRKGQEATYQVEGEANELGLKAQFGQLGRIDLAFESTEAHTLKPPKGCTGPPSRSEVGRFVGTIEFTGEREFVRIDASEAKGSMDVPRESEWRCRKGDRSAPRSTASRSSTSHQSKQSKTDREQATLTVFDRRCRCYFGAISDPDRKRKLRAFYGVRFEEKEGMEISRVTFAGYAGASTFTFNHAAGTAAVRPPAPFSGHGTFKRRPHARDLWKSTIRIPLLGADPLNLGEKSYRAHLLNRLPQFG